jgi:hypothetical protein
VGERVVVPARRRPRSAALIASALAVCAALVLPRGEVSADATDAGTDGAAPSRRTPPDPPALSERTQWVFDLRWERGEVYLVGVHKVDMGAPHVTPRVMGRFALELYEGPTLLERVRFDFPLLGGDPDAGPFERKLKTRIGVFFPATRRGTRLELWDRARDQRWPLAWPPSEAPDKPDGAAG